MASRQPQPGETHPEESPAPFVKHELDAAAALGIGGLDDVARRIARPGECRGKLTMGRFRSHGRRETENGFSGHVQAVLEAA